MSLTSASLGADALTLTQDGFALRLGLPWIRSMPLSSVRQLSVSIDGQQVDDSMVTVILGARRVSPQALVQEVDRWWYLQDRLVIAGQHALSPGTHRVSVDFTMLVPYLSASPGSPLVLPFSVEAELEVVQESLPSVARDVA